jgi:kynurenine formamidase
MRVESDSLRQWDKEQRDGDEHGQYCGDEPCTVFHNALYSTRSRRSYFTAESRVKLIGCERCRLASISDVRSGHAAIERQELAAHRLVHSALVDGWHVTTTSMEASDSLQV